MAKISVIVPIYNVEKYLKECLDSIINQTFQDIEIILINDGSTDNSLQIMQEYAKNDSRIIIINQENKGQSISRNSGIKYATSKYLSFIDADDFIEKSMFEKLYKKKKKENSDIIKCRYRRVKENSSYTSIVSKINNFENKDSFFKDILSLNSLSVIWDGLYKKELFVSNSLEFPIMYYEDVAFCFKLFFYAKKISISDDILYNWRQRDGSITRSINNQQIKDIFKIFDITYDFLIKNSCYKQYKTEFISRCIIQLNRLIKKIENFDNNPNKRYKYFNKVNKSKLSSSYFSPKNLEFLRKTNISLYLLHHEHLALINSYLFSKQNEIQNTLYKLNIKLLKQEIQISNYLEFIEKNFKTSKKILSLKNKFKNKDCYILGQGSSYHQFNKHLLKDKFSFIFSEHLIKIDKSEFTPTFYVGDEKNILLAQKKYIQNSDIKYKFISSFYKDIFNKNDNFYYYNELDNFTKTSKFSFKQEKYINKSSNSMFTCLQFAYYMGFKKVYLLGIDLDYNEEIFTLSRDTTKEGLNKIIKDFKYAKKIFKKDNKEIINLSKNSILKMFKYEEIKD